MSQWSIPFDVLAARIHARVEDVVRKVTFDLFSALLVRSPVDTGRFRANWNISYGKVDPTIDNMTSDGRIKESLGKVMKGPVGGIVYMCNSLPYAGVLEYGGYPNPAKSGTKTVGGFSLQAPSGMVRITAQEYAQYVQTALASSGGAA